MNVVTSEVGIRELRLQLSRYLKAVEHGKEVLVTDRGRPIARLVPAWASSHRLADLIATGEVEAGRTAKDEWLPEPVELAPGVTVSDLIAEQRR